MFQMRSAGILLPISSLPSDGPIGDFGDEAYNFLEFMEQSSQRWWQILPLNPLDPLGSPYSSTSSFAIESAYLNSKEACSRFNIEPPADFSLDIAVQKIGPIEYEKLWEIKVRSLETLCAKQIDGCRPLPDEFIQYEKAQDYWLHDYALFEALKSHYRTSDWTLWPMSIRDRNDKAIKDASEELKNVILKIKFIQFLVEAQWQKIRRRAASCGVLILGDLPFYVSVKSSDVWANQKLFCLDAVTKKPIVVAGVPPDAFNPLGQKWGNALFHWRAMEDDGFRWWLSRIARQLELYDAVRLDHFIGFYRSWQVPVAATNAISGSWDYAPGRALLGVLKKFFPGMPFVAEDLGRVTPEVFALRDAFGLPGMRVMQFGFGDFQDKMHLPHQYLRNCIAYTGTHDNNTIKGWIESLKGEPQLGEVEEYFDAKQSSLCQAMVRACYASVANTAIIPLQDILSLGAEARLNRPGEEFGNWQWRLGTIRYEWQSQFLSNLVRIFDR